MPNPTENKKTDKLTELIVKFCMNTVAGQERGRYRILSQYPDHLTSLKLSDLKIDSNKNKILDGIILHCLVNYLNDCYRSLILQDDPIIVNIFAEMKAVRNHSETCLMNFILHICMTTFKVLNRDALNIETYNSYAKSVELQTYILEYVWCAVLKDCFNHQCSGRDIREEDPNIPFIKFRDDFTVDN
jgi:hypothetical protein